MKKLVQYDIKDHLYNRYHIKIYSNNKMLPYSGYTCFLYKYHWLFEGWRKKVYKYETTAGILKLDEIAQRTLVSYLTDLKRIEHEKEKFYQWAKSRQ